MRVSLFIVLSVVCLANETLAQVQFQNVTEPAGISTPSSSSSSFTHSWADFNNDGYWDLFIAHGDLNNYQVPQVYLNQKNGSFTDITSTAFPPFDPGYYAHMCFGDFDNDGFVDVYQDAFVSAENRLWKNNGNLTFSNVTQLMSNPGGRTVGTVWSDFDKDGYIDLLVNAQGGQGTLCYHNDNGASLTQMSGFLTNPVIGDIAITTDINQDGWPDFYLADHASPDVIFLTESGNTTTSFNTDFLTSIFNNGDNRMTACFGDIDGDGYSELLIADNGKLRLWHNNKGESFTDITVQEGLDTASIGDHRMSFMQDVDNDGYMDILLYNNLDSSEIWYGSSTGFRRTVLGVAMNTNAVPSSFSWTDFDNDGFLDLMDMSLGVTELWHNLGNSNLWLSVTLRGHKANSMGLGSQVYVYSNGKRQTREIGFCQGYYGYQPAMAHFGFGSPGCEASSGVIDSLVILWQPGGRQVLTNVRYNQTILVDQDSGIVRAFQRPLSVSNGYAYPEYDNTVKATVGQSVTIPVALRFPLSLHVDTMAVSSVTFSLSYDPNVIDINAAKMSQYYSPPAGWVFKSGSIHGDTVTVTMGNAGGSMLANPTDLGRLRFDTYKNNPDRSMLYFCGASISTRGDTKVFCGDIEGSLLTVVIVSDTVSSSVASSSCPNTTDLSLQPNPSSGGVVKVHFPFKDDAHADIRVVDLLGRTVYSATDISVPSSAGTAELLIPAGAVSKAGAYRVEVTTPVQTLVTRFVVVQ